jgi:hypothetical protein
LLRLTKTIHKNVMHLQIQKNLLSRHCTLIF